MTTAYTRMRLEAAQRDGYLRVGWGKRGIPARNEWYGWCKMHQIPYILVVYRTIYADIQIDTDTLYPLRVPIALCRAFHRAIRPYAQSDALRAMLDGCIVDGCDSLTALTTAGDGFRIPREAIPDLMATMLRDAANGT